MHSVVSKICVNWIFVIFSPSFTTISDGASQRLYEDADDRLPRWTPLIWPTKQTWARYTVRPKYQQDDFKFKVQRSEYHDDDDWPPILKFSPPIYILTPPWLTLHPETTVPPRPTRRLWHRYTVRPIYLKDDFKYNKHSNDDTTIKLLIIIPFVAVVIIVLFCRYLLCNENGCCEDSTYTTEPTLHAPPPRSNVHRTTTTDWARSETNTNSLQFHTPSLTHMRDELFRSTPNVTAPSAPNLTYVVEENSSRRNGRVESNAPRASDVVSTPYDKPPHYSAVVIGGSSQIFPPVQTNQNLDMPPPKYCETDLPKY